MKTAVSVLLVPGCLFSLAVNAAEPVIEEWVVPWRNSLPRDPYVAPDGRIWFVGQRGDYVASLDPASGNFRQIPLDDGAGPHNVIVGKDGTLWYTGNAARHIGRIDPATGAIRKIPMPDERARDPHTLAFDEQGNIWFTVQGGNFIGKLDTTTEQIRLLGVPTPRARPYGISVHKGIVWVALHGTNRLARIDTATMLLEEIEIPRKEARPRRIAITSDGAVWYGDYAKGKLGRIDPVKRSFREWDLPSGDRARPYAVTVDSKDRIWLVETGVAPNLFQGFDPKTGTFFSHQVIESGGGTVRHMVLSPDGRAVWFGTDTNTIGRADLPE